MEKLTVDWKFFGRNFGFSSVCHKVVAHPQMVHMWMLHSFFQKMVFWVLTDFVSY